MIESLFIIGAVVTSFTGVTNMEECTQMYMDFVEFSDVGSGWMNFDWKGIPIEIFVMKTNENTQRELTLPVTYILPIEGCSPK